MWRRNGRNARRDKDATSKMVPSSGENRMAPLVGGRARRIQRDTVVLPQPLSPTRARVSPRADCEADVLHGAHLPGLALQETATNREFLKQAVDLEYGHAVASACAVSAIA